MGQKRKSPGGAAASARKIIAQRRRARHEYEILEVVEAGIQLRGTEVKVLREGKVSLEEAYGRIHEMELFLVGAHIEPYSHASVGNHEPTRERKLLIRKAELRKLRAKVTQKGLTLVPLELYFNERGLAKIEMGLARGKRLHDKRQDLREREARREIKKHV